MTARDQTPHRRPQPGPSTLPRMEVAGLSCTLASIDQLVAAIGARLGSPDPDAPTASILCVNAHIFNLAWEDRDLHQRLNKADVLALDGMSMVWAARRAGAKNVTRCNMTEALHAFLADPSVPPSRALLIGLDHDSALEACSVINAMQTHTHVEQVVDGYQDVTVYRDAVATGSYDLVLVGCGTPRSEEVAAAVAAAGHSAVVWHVGGGTLQFLAGNATEAPAWMRRSGLQWVHRLAADPRAMWRRYLVGNPQFVGRVLRATRPGSRRR